MSDNQVGKPGNGRYSVFLPALLIAAALVATLGTQTADVMREKVLLNTAVKNQTEPMAKAEQVRQQFQKVVGGTAELAKGGNRNAQTFIDQLKAQGINVKLTDKAKTEATGDAATEP